MITEQLTRDSQTKVKIRHTEIKFFNADSDSVDVVTFVGKLNVGECQKHIRDLNKDNVLINKENVTEEFYVNTAALYDLKEDEIL